MLRYSLLKNPFINLCGFSFFCWNICGFLNKARSYVGPYLRLGDARFQFCKTDSYFCNSFMLSISHSPFQQPRTSRLRIFTDGKTGPKPRLYRDQKE